MITRATLLWMLLAVTAGLGLFVLKYEVRSMEERTADARRATLRDLEAIHVLKAEWSYLNQPARLERLATRLLGLEPAAGHQADSIRDIPFRPADEPEHGPAAEPAHPPAADHVSPLLAQYQRVP